MKSYASGRTGRKTKHKNCVGNGTTRVLFGSLVVKSGSL